MVITWWTMHDENGKLRTHFKVREIEIAITQKLFEYYRTANYQPNYCSWKALSDDMKQMQIRSEFRSGQVKRSWNIRLGQNLEASHLPLVLCARNRLNDYGLKWVCNIFRVIWATCVQRLPIVKEHRQDKFAQIWRVGTNAVTKLPALYSALYCRCCLV